MNENVLVGKSRLSHRLYTDLLNGILSGDFPADTRLPPEERIARDYGMSRSTVRTALGRLKSEGFVASRQGSGTVVCRTNERESSPFAAVESLADLQKCYECRIAMEGEIAYLAAKRRTDDDARFFGNHLAALRQITVNGTGQTTEDADFHVRLASVARNQFLESIMVSIRPHILFGLNISKTLPAASRRKHAAFALKEHEQVVSAILDGNAEAARDNMRNHISQCRKRLFGAR